MATQKKIIGRVPVSRQGYTEGTTYYKDNIVTYGGSAFQCTADGATAAPAVFDDSGNMTVNAGWQVFADASAARAAESRLDKLDGEVEKVSSETSALIAGLEDSLDFAELPLLCGQPMKLFGHGTPSADSVPDNWKQLADGGYDWNGVPSALGQEYINVDSSTGGHYIAVRDTGMRLKWYNC